MSTKLCSVLQCDLATHVGPVVVKRRRAETGRPGISLRRKDKTAIHFYLPLPPSPRRARRTRTCTALPSLLPSPLLSARQPRAPHCVAMVSSCLASPAAARGGSALRLQQQPRGCRVTCLADAGGTGSRGKAAGGFACGLLAAWAVASAPSPVIAAGQVGGSLRLHGHCVIVITLSIVSRLSYLLTDTEMY
jgi:hypothetical protein